MSGHGNGVTSEILTPSEQRIVHAVCHRLDETLDLLFAKVDELTDEVEAALDDDDDEPDEDDDDVEFETRKRR